jgi:hypothetical protein
MRWLGSLCLITSLWAAGHSTDSNTGQQTRLSNRAIGPASIAGVVLNSLTGKPLDGVHVRLVGFGSDHWLTSVYGAMSNAAGRFSIEAVPPGVYIVALERRGFIMVPAKNGFAAQGAVELKPGERQQDVALEMAPRSVIAGRVIDEYGEPMMGITVDALPLGPQVVPALSRTQVPTDDRGEFRLSVPPGKYYLKARNWASQGHGPSEIRSDGTVESDYLETYYPGATSIDAATPVEAKPGEEIHPEFRLARSPVLSISGVVIGIPETATSVGVNVEWGPDPSTIQSGSTQPWAASSHEGLSDKFQLAHLAPGFYRISAVCEVGEARWQSQVVEISLFDSNVEDVRLALTRGFEVTGSVAWDSASTPVATREKPSIRLQGIGSFALAGFSMAEVASDGVFTMQDVFAGRYRVVAEPMPENGFVKAVLLNGAPVPDGILDLSGGAEGARLKIVLSAFGGQISGRVEDERGAVPSLFDNVILFPEPEEIPAREQVRFSAVGTDGAYAFHGLAPGRYRLSAVSRSGMSWWHDLKAEINRLHTTADVIEIKEGDVIVRNLKTAGGEGPDATPK